MIKPAIHTCGADYPGILQMMHKARFPKFSCAVNLLLGIDIYILYYKIWEGYRTLLEGIKTYSAKKLVVLD